MEFAKQFFKLLEWTRVKASLMLSIKNVYPKLGEIWWASVGYNIGVEANGKNDDFERLVIILNVFNKDSVLIMTLTTKIKDNKFMFPITTSDSEFSAINMSQIRNISTKRLSRKLCDVAENDFKTIQQSARELLLT
jgi:mRNA-degrading endonuclease toxin of MazEF toxin-antitoxin module